MKHLKYTITIMLGLLIGISLQAQEVTGNNLNIGSGNTINNNNGNAIGTNNVVNSQWALSVGMCDTIEELSRSAVTLGEYNLAGGVATMALGNTVKVTGDFSMGMGRFVKTNGRYSITLGNGIPGSGNTPSVFLENNNHYSMMIGFHSIKPTLTIGPSPNDYPQGDTVCKTGRIAIGDVPMPDIAAKLHIRSDYEEDAGIILEPKDPENSNTFIRMRDEDHGIEVTNTGTMIVKSMDDRYIRPLLLKGSVGINIPDNYIEYMEAHPTYSLSVFGGIVAEKVAIKQINHLWWPDYVFNADYSLMPLDLLREYISENHHLPEVPSESEVMEEGIELGNMQSILLKKIEELTLYTLQLQEEVKTLQAEIDELKGN